MKAYKITLLVIDFENVGAHIPAMIENQKYPNYCIAPKVKSVESVDIGEWSDEHPLNKRETANKEYKRLFNQQNETPS